MAARFASGLARCAHGRFFALPAATLLLLQTILKETPGLVPSSLYHDHIEISPGF